MKDLEAWLQQQREDLPPGCNLRALFCGGSGNIFFEITGPFYGSPLVWGTGSDAKDATAFVEERVRRIREIVDAK
jgi:hypothetical protein